MNPSAVTTTTGVAVTGDDTVVLPAVAVPPAHPPSSATGRGPVPEGPVAQVPEERPARCLPGAPALLVGAVAAAVCCLLLWWMGALPSPLDGPDPLAHPGRTADPGLWGAFVLSAVVALLSFAGLTRGRVGNVWVLTRCGAYRGTVRRTGLLWIDPTVRRHRVDVRLRHWRSRTMDALDAQGVRLRTTVLLVWRVRDSARARFAVDDHEAYLRELVESAVARVFSRLPADDFQDESSPTLRDGERIGEELTSLLAAEARPAGVEVFAARPVRVEYAPEVAASMHRSRVAALDARYRSAVLEDVVDAVEETMGRLTRRGLVELDAYERQALAKDLTVAFYTARGGAAPYAGRRPAADAR